MDISLWAESDSLEILHISFHSQENVCMLRKIKMSQSPLITFPLIDSDVFCHFLLFKRQTHVENCAVSEHVYTIIQIQVYQTTIQCKVYATSFGNYQDHILVNPPVCAILRGIQTGVFLEQDSSPE